MSSIPDWFFRRLWLQVMAAIIWERRKLPIDGYSMKSHQSQLIPETPGGDADFPPWIGNRA